MVCVHVFQSRRIYQHRHMPQNSGKQSTWLLSQCHSSISRQRTPAFCQLVFFPFCFFVCYSPGVCRSLQTLSLFKSVRCLVDTTRLSGFFESVRYLQHNTIVCGMPPASLLSLGIHTRFRYFLNSHPSLYSFVAAHHTPWLVCGVWCTITLLAVSGSSSRC